jgi:chromosome partitioning protein
MIIVCPNCSSNYEVDDEEIKLAAFRARCAKCLTIFTAYKPVKIDELKLLNINSTMSNKGFENVIALSNQKGGVAKTSTCLNLGYSLSNIGKRVLLIDFDPQANLTISLGYKDTKSFYDIITNEHSDFKENVLNTEYNNIWLFPSNKNMVLLNKKYFGQKNFEFTLKDRLSGLNQSYDYIIIDTPPSIEFFTINALSAASLVIIPTQCEFLSTDGIEQILKLINLVKEKTNPIIYPKILITMFEKDNTLEKMIKAKIYRNYSKMVFNTVIEKDNKIREALIMSSPVLKYNELSTSGIQYNDLCKEVSEIIHN